MSLQSLVAGDQIVWRAVNAAATSDWGPTLQPKFYINALVMKDANTFYAGGRFKSIGGISTSNVAYWNGESWNALGGGPPGSPGIVDTLALHQGVLYASGSFTFNGKSESGAKWDGSTWTAVSLGDSIFSPRIKQFVSCDGVLYVVYGDQILQLNGDAWTPLGVGTIGDYNPILAMSADRLLVRESSFALRMYRKHASGAWWGLPPRDASYVNSAVLVEGAGSPWSPTAFASGSSMYVQAADKWYGVTGPNSGVFKVGEEIFTYGSLRTGTHSFEERIFRWSGRRFYPLTWSPNAYVKHMAGSGNTLVMAGYFSSVDGVSSPGIIVGTRQPDVAPVAEITRQPFSHSAAAGQPIRLSVAATGKDLSYQWFELPAGQGEQPISGAIQPEMEVSTVVGSSSSRSFFVRITYAGGVLDSETAVVQVVTNAVAPTETVPSQSGIALIGQDWQFAPKVAASPVATFAWTRNGTALSVKQPVLPLKAVTLDGGGVFRAKATNSEGTIDLSAAYLSVVSPPPALVRVLVGNDALLRTVAKVPQDCTLSYQWLVDGQEIPGATELELKLTSALLPDNGDYSCRLTLHTPAGKFSRTTNATRVLVTQPPVLEVVANQDHYVLWDVSLQLVSFSLEAVRYTATGLPPGLKLDPVSGVISGKPTSPRLVKSVPVPYKVAVTARNAAGPSSVVEFDWLVRPLDAINVGTFYSVVGPQAPINNYTGEPPLEHELGTPVSITTTAQGRCTGWIVAAGQKLPFSGSIGRTTEPYSGLCECKVTIDRKAPLSDVTVLAIVPAEGLGWLSYVFMDGKEAFEQMIRLKPLPTTTPAGRYHVRLSAQDLGPEAPTVPEGDGYAVIQAARSGTLSWTGRLPDGTSFTSSGWHGDVGDGLSRVMMHVFTHRNRGSFLTGADCGFDGERLAGSTMFYKAATPGVRAVPGELREPMTMAGGLFHANSYIGALDYDFTSGPFPVIVRGSEHFFFSVDLVQKSLLGRVSERFRFKAAASKALDENLHAIRLSLSRSSGLISGDFVIKGETTKTDRKAAISALMIPVSNSPRRTRAYGQFFLPELPDAAGETLLNTPLHSGSVYMD